MNAEHNELCMSILDKLKYDQEQYRYFSAPAISGLTPQESATYLKAVPNPMDLGTVESQLVEGKYSSIAAFREDVNLCFENSKTYCKKRYPSVYEIAGNMQKQFRSHMDKALSKLTSFSSSSSSSTTAVDDDIDPKSNKKGSEANMKRQRKSTSSIVISPPVVDIEPPFEGDIINNCEKLVSDIANLNDLTKTLQKPVDMIAYPDYHDIIRYPIYFDLIQDRIKGRAREVPKKYTSLNQLSLDMRRLFSNFIIYNYVYDSARLRKQIINALTKFEQRWRDIMISVKGSVANVKFLEPLPELIPCIEAVDSALKVPVAAGKGFAIDGFMYPIDILLSGEELRNYKAVISKPVDFATIVKKLLEAEYHHMDEVKEDVRLVASNCKIFWTAYGGDAETVYINNAASLEKAFMKSLEERLSKTSPLNLFPAVQVLDNIASIGSSSSLAIPETTTKGSKSRPSISSAAIASLSSLSSSPQPSATTAATTAAAAALALPIAKRASLSSTNVKEESAASIQRRMSKYLPNLLRRVMEEVKKHFLMSTSIENLKIMTAKPFLKAVDPVHFPDYHTIISNLMDIGRIDKKIAGNRYENISAILNDMTLIRDNAYAYNTDKDSIEVPIMADALLDYFKHLIRTALLDLYLSSDDNLADALCDDMIQSFLHQPDIETVTKYLSYVETETGIKPHFKVEVAPPVIIAPVPSVPSTLSLTASNLPKKAVRDVSSWDMTSSIAGDDMNDSVYDDSSSIILTTASKSKANKHHRNSSSTSLVGLSSAINPVSRQSPSIEVYHPIVTIVRDKVVWEIACEKMLNMICKHPYVDLASSSVVANFHVPVAEVYPHLAEEYLRVIEEPMDLSTLRTRLDSFSILDAEDFYNTAVKIFQNALAYNQYQQSQAKSQGLLQAGEELIFRYRNLKYQHLIQYTKWVGMELPREVLTNDIDKEHPEKLGNLRLSLQEVARKDRESYMKLTMIDRHTTTSASGISDSDRLLKALRRHANNAEKQQIEFFQLPFDENLLADYFVYVRKPMDMATIKYKLDGSLPTLGTKPEQMAVISKIKHAKSYMNFYEFIEDMRRVFDNAIKYNGPHRTSDNTGVSQRIYDAAIFMQERLERLLPDYTLSLFDKLERHRLKKAEEMELYQRKQSRYQLIESNVAEYEAQEKEKLLAEDVYYAADMDAERRKELTRQQLIASRIAKKQQLEDMSMNKLGYVDDEFLDVDHMDMDAMNTHHGSKQQYHSNYDPNEVYIGPDGSRLTAYEVHLLEERRLQRLQEHLRIPMPLVRILEMKKRLRDAAWKHWEHYAIKKLRVIVKPNEDDHNHAVSSPSKPSAAATAAVIASHITKASDSSMDVVDDRDDIGSSDVDAVSGWVDVSSVMSTEHEVMDSSKSMVPITITWKQVQAPKPMRTTSTMKPRSIAAIFSEI